MRQAQTTLGIRDIIVNKIDILYEHRELQQRAMIKTKMIVSRCRVLVKMRWKTSLISDFHF